MENNKKEIPDAVRRYMSELGKRGGAVTKMKGSEHMKWVRSKNKTRPVKTNEKTTNLETM